jgi:hypothetical protein
MEEYRWVRWVRYGGREERDRRGRERSSYYSVPTYLGNQQLPR